MSHKKRQATKNEQNDIQTTPSSEGIIYEPVIDLAVDSPLRIQGNLTGIPRKLKDTSADWHNAKLKWAKFSQTGFVVCSKIGNIKMDCFAEGSSLPDTLLPLCDNLSAIVSGLQNIWDKMERWHNSLLAIRELLESQGKISEVIFQTWTISNFITASDRLLSAYCNELKLKRNIYENICHSQDKNEAMFMLACWSHEPYTDDVVALNLEAMVRETGHLPLT